jgi:hypothetical protein
MGVDEGLSVFVSDCDETEEERRISEGKVAVFGVLSGCKAGFAGAMACCERLMCWKRLMCEVIVEDVESGAVWKGPVVGMNGAARERLEQSLKTERRAQAMILSWRSANERRGVDRPQVSPSQGGLSNHSRQQRGWWMIVSPEALGDLCMF